MKTRNLRYLQMALLVLVVGIVAGVTFIVKRQAAATLHYNSIMADCNDIREYERQKAGEFGASVLNECMAKAAEAKRIPRRS